MVLAEVAFKVNVVSLNLGGETLCLHLLLLKRGGFVCVVMKLALDDSVDLIFEHLNCLDWILPHE